MVFPSTGCQTCKTRRIKCDETLPTCKKCIKAGRICTGIKAKERNLTVHVENTYASGHIKRPRGPRSSPPSQVQPPNKLIIRAPPSLDLETLAVTYYLHNHFRSPQKPDNENPPLSQNFSDIVIPKWIGKAGNSKMDNSRILELGISSIALAIFSRTQNSPQAALLASRYYQDLLKAARSMIRVVDVGEGDVDVDDCLLGVFFMGRFEDAVYSSSSSSGLGSSNGKGNGSWKGRGSWGGNGRGRKLNSYSHHDGALAILRMWRERGFQGGGGKERATEVVKHSRRGLIRSAFLRGLQLPRWMLDGEDFGERGLELGFDGLVVRVSGLRREIRLLLDKRVDLEWTTEELISRARELDREAEELDDDLRKWTAGFPESWDFQSHTLPSETVGMEDFYSDVVHSYSDLTSAGMWIQYYSTRMLINSSRLKTLDFIQDYSEIPIEDQRQECLSHISDRGKDLASSIPFCLQRFKVPIPGQTSITINSNEVKPYLATQIIWPLTLAANISHVDREQKAWFRAELARLGRIIGVGVIASANSSHRKDL